MAKRKFSLKDTRLLADQYSQAGDPEALALFQTVQSFYPPGQNPEGRVAIDPLKILKKLEKSGFPPENQEQSLTWLNSLREKLNRELFDIISRQRNPAELIVGPNYTFIQILENPQTKPEAASERRKFRESEISFNIPDDLRLEFEQQLGCLREKEMEENKVRLEEENEESHIRPQKLRDKKQKLNQRSKEQTVKETARPHKELGETREELETLRWEALF